MPLEAPTSALDICHRQCQQHAHLEVTTNNDIHMDEKDCGFLAERKKKMSEFLLVQ